MLAGETTATVTFVAGPDGLEAGAQAFFELLGVGTGPGVATYDVVVTAGSAVTTTSFDVFQGHGE